MTDFDAGASFPDVTVDAAELERAWRAGTELDCSASSVEGAVVRRRVDAELIREICRHHRDEVDPRGLRLRHAVITGVLDLAGIVVPFPLRFDDCQFEAAPMLHGAQIEDLAFVGGTSLPGLLGNGLRVRRDLDLSWSTVDDVQWTSASTYRPAAIWLCEAEIGGRLLFIGTVIKPKDGRAIQADRIRVGGTVRFLHGFQANNEVRMLGASIAGSLDLWNVLIRADDDALNLDDATIGGSLFIVNWGPGEPPQIHGRIRMKSVRIAGHLLIGDATIVGSRPDRDDDDGTAPALPRAITAQRLSVGADFTVDRQSSITGSIDLSSADLDGLRVRERCALRNPGGTVLNLTNAQLRSSLTLHSGVEVEGTIRLVGTQIRGRLILVGVSLSKPQPGASGDNGGGSLIEADHVTVDGDVDLHRLTTSGGQLKFWRATLNSGIDATGATLDNGRGPTLRLHQATVKGSVRLVNGFSSRGYVLLNRTMIEGRIDCTDASFECPEAGPRNPGGHALQAIATTARGGMALGWRRVEPSVDFTDAETTVLEDDPRNWPKAFYISGFRYTRFDVPDGGSTSRIWDWRPRREWLGRQVTYDAGPYEQAARVYRQHGYVDAAEQILMAQRADARHAPGGPSRLGRGLDAVYGWTVGYGYRPSRVLWLLALLLVLVGASLLIPTVDQTMRATDEAGFVYTTDGALASKPSSAPSGPFGNLGATITVSVEPDTCGDGRVRCFQPLLYAIDTVVPLVSLDQRSTWYPNPHAPWGIVVQWWLNLATIAGWILSSIFLLSFTRMARSA